MLPPMKPYSIAATIAGMPSSVPDPTMTASLRPVVLMDSASRSRYAFVSTNWRGSVDRSPASCVVHCPSSKSMRRRSAADMRK
jgi:hypothetical protein